MGKGRSPKAANPPARHRSSGRGQKEGKSEDRRRRAARARAIGGSIGLHAPLSARGRRIRSFRVRGTCHTMTMGTCKSARKQELLRRFRQMHADARRWSGLDHRRLATRLIGRLDRLLGVVGPGDVSHGGIGWRGLRAPIVRGLASAASKQARITRRTRRRHGGHGEAKILALRAVLDQTPARSAKT